MKKKGWLISFFVLLSVMVLMIIGWLVYGLYEENQRLDKEQKIENTTDQKTDTQEVATVTEEPTTEDIETQSVDNILSGMTLEQKVAQLFWVRCPDTDGAGVQQQYQFAGYILFGQDFKNKTRDDVVSNISSYQSSSNIPMLIGVDEEGGTVCRVSGNPAFREYKFESPRNLYAQGGYDLVVSDATEKAELLKSIGVNVNLAPVCDISTNESDYMYDRSFGVSADAASTFVSDVVTTSQSQGVGTVLKHFPGYGNNVNTHTGIAVDERPMETFTDSDFLPFEAGIEAGSGCVLVSHNIVNCMDDTTPASLSGPVHEILRNQLGFTGVIMTDDLSMDAIKDYTDGEDAAVRAVLAGNDLICCSDYVTSYNAVLAAVNDGTISEDQVNQAVTRVLRWKYQLGLIE